MSDHYCCKRCGLRYDDCRCVAQPLNPVVRAVEAKITGQRKPKATEKTLHPMQFCSVRIEVRPASSMNAVATSDVSNSTWPLPEKDDPGEYFLRLVARNGRVLFHSEVYSGGASKAMKRAQALVDSWYSQEVLCNVYYALDLDQGFPSVQWSLRNGCKPQLFSH